MNDPIEKFVKIERKKVTGTPRRAQTETGDVPLETLSPKPLKGVPDDEREGVYVHSFKCLQCDLHFMVLSWKADRHTSGTVICPECGGRGAFMHWRATINERRFPETPEENKKFMDASVPDEIYKLHPWPGSVGLDS